MWQETRGPACKQACNGIPKAVRRKIRKMAHDEKQKQLTLSHISGNMAYCEVPRKGINC
jgi:hypothetical protein